MGRQDVIQIFSMDSDPFYGMGMSNLQQHDAKYHPQGYSDGDFCRYRQALERGDGADDLAKAEKQEANEHKAISDIIARYNRVGTLVMTQPMSDGAYDNVLSEYGIKPGTNEYSAALSLFAGAEEEYDAEYGNNQDEESTDVIPLRKIIINLDSALSKLKNSKAGQTPGTKTGSQTQGQPAKPNAQTLPSKDDYEDLYEVRAAVEKSARLLNGRTGNIQALQSSSRWNLLNQVASDRNIKAFLSRLSNSNDKGVSSVAAELEKVVSEIERSSKNNWNNPAGMVPPESDLPPIPNV